MSKKIIETIIIGAGIAGLGCANHLDKAKKDFLIISENVGGRITTSPDGKVNYGAYFILDNYHHVAKFAKKGEKLHPFSVDFHKQGKRSYHLLKMFQYPLESFRFLYLLYKFKSKYEHFKKLCEEKSQKQVIENNSYFKKLYSQSAKDFVQKNRIKKIANQFLSEGVYMCTFLPLVEVSAFDFMRLCIGLIEPAYEFIFDKEKLTKNFAKKIITNSVTKVKKRTNYEIETKNGKKYTAKNIVLATPSNVSKKLIDIGKIKKPSNTYMFHITGELKKDWKKGQFELFNSNSSTIFIRKQKDNTYIFYSKDTKPNFPLYFDTWQIIAKKAWKPAFNISGKALLECKQAENLYLIGDHNLIGLEDSYISGLYAANEICKFA